jgi:hypothetical protein
MVLGIALATAASAAPPGRASIPSGAGTSDARGSGHLDPQAARGPGSDDRTSAMKLDLRAPTEISSWEDSREEPSAPSTDSPAMAARPAGGLRTRLEEEIPSLGTDRAVRSLSRAQEIAQRFRREGLPVARLFETRSALVSLGLNQRGKPGIWLIQKIP